MLQLLTRWPDHACGACARPQENTTNKRPFLLCDARGATSAEYTVLFVLIAVGALMAAISFGRSLGDAFVEMPSDQSNSATQLK